MYSNLFVLYNRKLKPWVGMRLPSESVVERSLDAGPLVLWGTAPPAPSGSSQTGSCVPLSPPRGSQPSLAPCFLLPGVRAEMLLYADTFSPHGQP